MIKVVDIVYHCHTEYTAPDELLKKHGPTLGFVPFLKDQVEYSIVRHLAYEGFQSADNIRYAFFTRPNKPWQIPLKTHRFIKSIQPDIVLVHGFVFPLQVIALKMILGKKCALVLQHHAERPLRSVRKFFQTMADRCISAYLFTAAEIAQPWLAAKVIKHAGKVKIMTAASVAAINHDRSCCKERLGISNGPTFLWVGRLNQNKDPLTVLKAFAQKVRQYPFAKLYMIYQTAELLPQVETRMEDLQLGGQGVLVGKLPNEEVSIWMHAADYFISASHAEAAGYALLEAMSAGCIPIVSRIPSYTTMLQNTPAYLFQPGSVAQLTDILINLDNKNINKESAAIKKYFQDHLSFQQVADSMLHMFNELYSVKR